jgi:hypothetical protein
LAIRSQETAQHYRQLIEEQQKSGQPITKFCTSHGITAWSFYYWRNKLAEVDEPPTVSSSPTFIPLTVRNNNNPFDTTQMTLLYPSGISIRVSTIQKLLQATLEFSQAVMS